MSNGPWRRERREKRRKGNRFLVKIMKRSMQHSFNYRGQKEHTNTLNTEIPISISTRSRLVLEMKLWNARKYSKFNGKNRFQCVFHTVQFGFGLIRFGFLDFTCSNFIWKI